MGYENVSSIICGHAARAYPNLRLSRLSLHYLQLLSTKAANGIAYARDIFVGILDQVRSRYGFDVIGYVVMPEHFHLMVTEPDRRDPSVVMKVLKQTVARKLLAEDADHFWHKRFYDFNVYSQQKFAEKLRYMHRNPVTRGLVQNPEDWKWSYRTYAFKENGPVRMDWYFAPHVLGRSRVRMLG